MLSHLDFVIVSSAREQRLIRVKVHPSDGSVVFVESIDQGSHAIVPQLDDAGVQRGEDPRPLRVERQAFHPVRFRLELGQHFLLNDDLCVIYYHALLAGPSASDKSFCGIINPKGNYSNANTNRK